jgi:hypothetical protein
MILNFNLAPFDLILTDNGFTKLPKLLAMTNMVGIYFKGNELDKLESHYFLPKKIETMDFRYNKIGYIQNNFFWFFPDLRNVYLDHNRIRVIAVSISFISLNIKVLSFGYNKIEEIELGFATKENQTMHIDVLDLSGNRLIAKPKIDGTGISIGNLSFDDQVTNDFIDRKPIKPFFEDLPPILDRLSFRNMSLHYFLGKDNYYKPKCTSHFKRPSKKI